MNYVTHISEKTYMGEKMKRTFDSDLSIHAHARYAGLDLRSALRPWRKNTP
jgi:hypothetical protein